MRSDSKDGSINETMIRTALDKHKYKDLDDNWKRHIKRMFKNIKDDDLIIARYHEFKDAKPDLEITVNDRTIFLSVKSGHAPTMHYEPLKTFFDFLRSFDVPERIIKIIAFYHYGYSLKKGYFQKTLTRDEIIVKYPKEIREASDYFRQHQGIVRELIYRAIIRGRLKRDLIDYLYYGNSAKGFLLSVSDIIKLIIKDTNESCDSICFHSLTYISCARSKNKDRQHHCKINWPILCKYYYDETFMRRYG